MAGSYKHATAEDGQLLRNEDFPKMVENLGDAYETVEELYGMVWLLADVIAQETVSNIEDVVEDARSRYQEGLQVSPGTDGKLADDE